MYFIKINIKKILILLISCIYSLLCNAINFENESLRDDIKKNIKKGVFCWSKQQYDSAAFYLEIAELEARRIKDTQLLIACNNNQGLLYLASGEYDRGIRTYKEVLSISSDSIYKRSKLLALLNIGIIYKRKGDYEEAFKWLIKTQEFAESFPVGLELASCFNLIGIIKEEQEKYTEALQYHKKSLKIRKEHGYQKGIVGSLNNLASVYKKQGLYSKALNFYNESLALAKQLKNREYLAYIYHNIGDLEIKIHEYSNARVNIHESLRLRKEIADIYGVVASNVLLSKLNIIEKKYFQARTNLLSARNMAEEINALELQREVFLQLKNLYAAQNKGKQALAYYDKYIAVKDSIFNTENMQHMQEMETRYQTREKEQQIEVLNIEKEAKAQESLYMKIVLGVFLFSMLPLAFFMKQRQKTRLLQERIAGENRECNRISRDLHDGVASSLSHLCRSMEKEDTEQEFAVQLRKISDEVRGISHQLNMTAIGNQKFREALSDSLPLDHFPKDIDLKIHLSEDFEIDDYKKKIYIIRIVQELINNSLKHAQAATIIIKFKKDNSKLQLEYADDGVGVDLEKISKGNGWHNIHERAEFLSGKLKIDSSEGNGFYLKLVV